MHYDDETIPDNRPIGNQPVQRGDILTLEVESFGDNGDGLCRVQNYVIWVPGALPGETVEVEVTSASRKNARAELLNIEAASPHRVEPRCKHFGPCGGCQLQHFAYEQQLLFKTSKIEALLRHVMEREEVPVHPCVGPEEPWGTRSRIALQITEQHGRLSGGLFRRRSRELVEIDECPVSDPNGFRVAMETVEAARSIGTEAWDDRTDGGTLRTALVRTNPSGESELTLVTRRNDKRELDDLMDCNIPAKSIYVNTNDAGREKLLGWQTTYLSGDRQFSSSVGDKKIVLSSAAWLRTSNFAIEKVAEIVLELLAPIPDAIVADLYAGSGALSLAIADHVKSVYAIEEHPRAVVDAVASVKANNLDNVFFREGKVEAHLPDLKDKKLYAAIMDPPPDGCGRYIINALAKVVRPEKLIYISQNPTSFAHEAVVFEDRGYRLTAVRPVDVAPHTGAVEIVALFESSMQGGKRRSSISQGRRLLDRIRKDEK